MTRSRSNPRRKGEDSGECAACNTPDDAYIWVSERWRVRAMDRPTGLPMVLILESRSHLDLGDLPNLLAAELGVMTVRLERAIRSLDGVARVHVNRWGDGSAHLHMWFLARPYGQLQLRGTFLSLWDDILPPISEAQWRENLALVAAWLAEFGGTALAEPPHIQWQAPSSLTPQQKPPAAAPVAAAAAEETERRLPSPSPRRPRRERTVRRSGDAEPEPTPSRGGEAGDEPPRSVDRGRGKPDGRRPQAGGAEQGRAQGGRSSRTYAPPASAAREEPGPRRTDGRDAPQRPPGTLEDGARGNNAWRGPGGPTGRWVRG